MNFFKNKLKKIQEKNEISDKKKIENIVVLIIILIITIVIINMIIKEDKNINEEQNSSYKTLADKMQDTENSLLNDNNAGNNLERSLEKILNTIKGVGKVNVFVNYSESSKVVAMYDEKTTTSTTEENDSQGGLRNTTSTEIQKDVIFSEEEGSQVPATEKVINPTIEGAIVTAEGAANLKVKTDIINAVQAVTGLSIEKIQVFELE